MVGAMPGVPWVEAVPVTMGVATGTISGPALPKRLFPKIRKATKTTAPAAASPMKNRTPICTSVMPSIRPCVRLVTLVIGKLSSSAPARSIFVSSC